MAIFNERFSIVAPALLREKQKPIQVKQNFQFSKGINDIYF